MSIGSESRLEHLGALLDRKHRSIYRSVFVLGVLLCCGSFGLEANRWIAAGCGVSLALIAVLLRPTLSIHENGFELSSTLQKKVHLYADATGIQVERAGEAVPADLPIHERLLLSLIEGLAPWSCTFQFRAGETLHLDRWFVRGMESSIRQLIHHCRPLAVRKADKVVREGGSHQSPTGVVLHRAGPRDVERLEFGDGRHVGVLVANVVEFRQGKLFFRPELRLQPTRVCAEGEYDLVLQELLRMRGIVVDGPEAQT